jgi:hypothetical protein
MSNIGPFDGVTRGNGVSVVKMLVYYMGTAIPLLNSVKLEVATVEMS